MDTPWPKGQASLPRRPLSRYPTPPSTALPIASFDAIVPFTRAGQSMFVRRAAAVAVARLAESAQKKGQASELLAELMRDPEFRVQLAAIQGARLLGDRRLLGALEGTRFRDGRVRRAAREAARALRAGEPQAKEVLALREEVDRLKEESRKLKERLDALGTTPAKAGAGRKPPARKPAGRRSGKSGTKKR